MAYQGDIRLSDTLDFHFTTRQISGAPSTLSSSPVISAYPSNSTTQLTAGITLDVDFDSVTGLNHVRIVASGANGYATATDYSLVITTGTVNSVSVVGEVIGSFSIEHRSALMPATAARTLVVDASGLADANMVKNGPSGSGTAVAAGSIPNAVAGAAGGIQIAGSNAATTFASMTVTGNLTLGNISNAGTTTLTGAITGGATTLASLTSTGTMTAGNISVGGTTTLTGAVTTGALTSASMTSTGTMSMGNVSVGGTTTLTGAVSLGSTLGITGATTLAAISAASIAVSGNTTLTGIVTAANVSNNIVGVTVGNVTLAASQGNITMNITGNLSGSVGSVTGLTVSNLDATISSRMATFTLPTNFSALAITAGGAVTAGTVSDKTGYSLTSAEENAIADAMLNRNVAGGSSSGRLVKEGFYVLRNKVDTGAGIVYQVDDTTTAFTFSVTTAPGNPVTVFDPS